MLFKLRKPLSKKTGSSSKFKEIVKADTIETYYDRLCETQVDDVKAVGWINQQTQRLRFINLSLVGDLEGKTVLDLGCGLGALFEFIQTEELACDYKGIDISKKMVKRARENYPGVSFESIDFLSKKYHSEFDFILASGAFSMPVEDPYSYLEKMIRKMLDLAKDGVAFNCLSDRSPVHLAETRFMYYNPSKVLELALSISPYVSISHHYLPNDFTVFIYPK